MIDGNKLARAGIPYIGIDYDDMDCQEFVEQCLRDCGLNMNLAGSNAWYREVMKNGVVMTPEECVSKLGTVPPGAFLFIHAYDGGEEKRGYHDGLGNASHIGLVTGFGEGAIHSSSSRGCVCESKFKGKTIKGGWNMVGLYNKIAFDYGNAPSPVATPVEPIAVKKFVFAEEGKTVNMRIKPYLNASLVDKVPIGSAVEYKKESGAWSYIKYNNKYGWMMSCYLVDEINNIQEKPNEQVQESQEQEPVQEAGEELTVYSENGKYVKLRAKPSTSCNLYDDVPCGATVTLVSAGTEWCKVNHGKRKGWYMMTKFLTRG